MLRVKKKIFKKKSESWLFILCIISDSMLRYCSQQTQRFDIDTKQSAKKKFLAGKCKPLVLYIFYTHLPD